AELTSVTTMREMLEEKLAIALTSNAHMTSAVKQDSKEADVSFMSTFASLPTTSHSPQNWASVMGMQKCSSHGQQQGRKRRRGEIANPANTLDGLVARRADNIGSSESLIKRYLTENEAIESPSDDQEMKRIETDPDVSTRTCSICGYQGKWVSEMIRHKRVHTNERPFKCKYCSRTSKWKADLIRHVAKTHGIRVVSKYSRSKTFDASATALHELKDNKPQVLQTQPKPITYTINVKPLPTSVIKSAPIKQMPNILNEAKLCEATRKPQCDPIAYRCVLCLFEQESLLILISHLRNVHNAMFYECRSCNKPFMDALTASKHFNGYSRCSRSALLANIVPVYVTSHEPSPLPVFGASANNNAQDLLRRLLMSSPATANTLLPLLSQVPGNSTLSALGLCNNEIGNCHFAAFDNYTDIQSSTCDKCPFKGDSDGVVIHKKGHDMPKGLLNYKCAFCDWFAKRKSSIEEHMRVHTNNPQLYMAEVEKNLITPVTLSKYANDSAAVAAVSPDEGAFNASLTNLSPLSANAAIPEQVPHLPCPSTFDLTALLAVKQHSDIASMLSLSNLAALSSAIGTRLAASRPPYPAFSTELTPTSPSSPDNLSLHNHKINHNFGLTQVPLLIGGNSISSGLNSLSNTERYGTPSPTDSSASSCSPASGSKLNNSLLHEPTQLDCYGQREADRPMSANLKMCEAIMGSFQNKSFESPDVHTNSKEKTNEEDEIVDVENVDSCDESGSAKHHLIN
uniref:C2H2-type domain-containing protein n=1 Tax=Parascaris univalens TaxID=6257 RepID=A0A915BVJ0_PARUN